MSDRPDGSDQPPDGGEPPRRLGLHPLARILSYCGTLLLVLNLSTLIVLTSYLAIRGETGDLTKRLEELSQTVNAELLLVSYLVVGPVVWLWTRLYRTKIEGRSMRSLGFAPGGMRSTWIGIAIGALAPGLIVAAGFLSGVYGLADPSMDGSMQPATTGTLMTMSLGTILKLLLLFAGFVLQSGSEELVLRGYVQRNMVEWKGPSRNLVWILIVPSLLFSLFHGFNPDYSAIAAVNTVLIGVLFGAIVLANGQLWTAIGLHAGWNFGLACIWSLPVSGLSTHHLLSMEIRSEGSVTKMLFGGGYGPEGGLLSTAIVVAGMAWALPKAMDRWMVDGWGLGAEDAAAAASAGDDSAR
ncbi:MAG: CPBP family intramembrane metalloprotease [Candidatus Eisenbacteria bacterium]|uniref:CPBP family intramembrane metalloprotease n=1 Tax=Eiseniibacteriota bacterium TaxID=2212470 RepID=A0A956LWB8_UNCEI|nr:CPBP family intramembrane metalloprotease [Candidatus Eisenbacteria bacterium]